MSNYLAPIVFKAITSFYPMSNHTFYEDAAITKARYESIAEDIAVGSVLQPIFEGDEGAIKTALLLASIANFESGGYAAAVDQCKRAGDHGLSWTIFQLQMAYSPKREICANRKKAVEWAIHWIKVSFQVCHALPLTSRLSAYTAGRCINGEPKSRQRIQPAIDFLRDHHQEISEVLKDGF